MPTDGETLKEVDEFIGFEYFIIKHTFQTSEHNSSAYKDKYITFSASPQFVD